MPLAGGLAMISGYAGEHPKEKIEAAASVPYPLWGNIAIDGVLLSDAPHCARVIDQKYDFSCGELRAENRAEWQDLWKGRIKLIGADRQWQAMADAGFFYLNCSVHASSPASTSIFGLATWKNYHYYYGHVMWDIESFVIPAVTLFQPHAAMSMLEYRFRCLDGARRNAHLFGRRGLSFPWESAPFAGYEAAPLPGTGSW